MSNKIRKRNVGDIRKSMNTSFSINSVPASALNFNLSGFGDVKLNNPRTFMDIASNSDRLPSLINSMAFNIGGYGWEVDYKSDFDIKTADPHEIDIADQEKELIYDIFSNISMEFSFEEILYKALYDQYTIGYGVLEVIRDVYGKFVGLEYAPAVEFSLAPQTEQERKAVVKTKKTILGQSTVIERFQVFRKFMQSSQGKNVYFKDLLDPRPMNFQTGEYGPTDTPANEIILLQEHNVDPDKLSLPIWYGAIIEALGNRKASEANLKFFTSGKLVPFAITVTNGYLTEESLMQLQDGNGIGNFYKAFLLEANQDEEGGNLENITPNINVHKLSDTTLKDGLFQEYQENSRNKQRCAFGVPPILTGETTDYNRSTAFAAISVAEEQIFYPRRRRITNAINKLLCYSYDLQFTKIKLNSPELSDDDTFSTAIAPFIQSGAVTPNELRPRLSKLLQTGLNDLKMEEANVPIVFNGPTKSEENIEPDLTSLTLPDNVSRETIEDETEKDEIIDDTEENSLENVLESKLNGMTQSNV